MFPGIDRVYVNERARRELGWEPKWDFRRLIGHLRRDEDVKSPSARLVGSKRYHAERFVDGPYPVQLAGHGEPRGASRRAAPDCVV
jgi:hypothetical protein